MLHYFLFCFCYFFVPSFGLICQQSVTLNGKPRPEKSSSVSKEFEPEKIGHVTCPADTPDRWNYCFSGQFVFPDENDKLALLVVKDCAFNLPEVVKTLASKHSQEFEVDCRQPMPAGKNTSETAHVYRCCDRPECELPVFRVDDGNSAGAVPTLFVVSSILILRFFQ